ncbi:MAG: VapC toxin family PIN domain ribonuclease [Acidobacteria bacterium]|nr:MAG: VapC toxin family PIN domain ribonuclease [Acidobacteriota bacterium]
MIVLDTNTLSEALKPSPSKIVLRWLIAQEASAVFITTITQAKVFYGIEVLSAGKRRTRLSAVIEKLFSEDFQGRILSFDEDSARVFAKIVTGREAAGRPISQFDAMIAAIARSRGAAVATRNTNDFEHCGIRVINPWNE